MVIEKTREVIRRINTGSIKNILSYLWMIIILVSGTFAFFHFRDSFTLKVEHWPLAIVGFFMGIVASSPMMIILNDYLVTQRTPKKYAISFILTFLPAIAKYIPGKIWSIAGFLQQAKILAGISAKDASLFLIYSQVISLVSSSFLSLSGLLLFQILGSNLAFLNDLLMGVSALLVIGSLCLFFFWRLTIRLGSNLFRDTIVWHVGLLTFQKVLKSISLFIFICAFVPVQEFFFEITLAFVISMQLGLLAFFAPAGLGVVEGIYVFLLAGTVSPSFAVNIAVIARILQLCLDFTLSLIAFVIKVVYYKTVDKP